MPFPSVKNAVEIPLEVFGGRVTEMSPDNVPEGCSPDEQDNAYSPGSVFTRPNLERTLTDAPANTTVTYEKSFVTDAGDIKNLYLFSNGQLFWEDPINTPGVVNLLYTGPPGSYAKSATMFGREFIGISDALHGATVPLQWDGVNLDRVTQDGPAAAPVVSSFAYPPASLTAASSPATFTVIAAVPIMGPPIYRFLDVTFSTAPGATLGQSITLSGSSSANCDGTFPVISIISPTEYHLGYYSVNGTSGLGGTGFIGSSSGTTLTRFANTVTGQTSTDHNLQVGYLAQIAGVAATPIGGGIVSVVVDNENFPGVATITTSTAHGLAPEENVFLDAIAPVVVAVASYSITNGIADIVTSTPHGLSIGSSINSVLGPSGGLLPQTVLAIISATEFIETAVGTTGTSSGTVGSVQYLFPLANANISTSIVSPGLNTDTFKVLQCPSSTTFQVAFTYTDGTWSSGVVSFAWDGSFYVTAVPSSTSFAYQQYGPDLMTTGSGTITPFGQAAPGFHLLRCNFLTRQGAVLKSGPFVKFVANGGQYLSITDLPIGPENVIARILEFTGADGAYFLYLPVPAQVNGQVVSTATQINDNTTTQIVLDFSDNSLFGGLATSIPGNDLITQIVLDGALGFGQYATRLITYGQRNRIQNLLNLSFDGGFLAAAPTLPLGWVSADTNGALASNANLPPSSAWLITAIGAGGACGSLSQSAYQDAYGNPILTGSTPYKLRVWLQPSALDSGLNFSIMISSASTSFTSTATINGASMSLAGSFVEADFSLPTPVNIPTDMLLTISASSTTTTRTLLVDEISPIYAQTPYLDGILFGSYGNNEEGIAGVTGKFGPVTDTRKVMDYGVMRETFYMLTQEPSGRLHETTDNGTTEPSGWEVNEVGANCGALSAFSLTKSQADDTAASGGEEWMAWASLSGARIFGGAYPDKISQEIQPDWENINSAAAKTVWCVNDPVARSLYFGVPMGTATAPSNILFMSYRELDSAQAIASSAPFRVSFSGKLIATDNCRKWSLWNMSMNCAALMYRMAGNLSMVMGAGNGVTPGTGGFGNVYTLNPNKYTDDDYGQVDSYYFTYAFVNRGAEQALQVGSHQKGFLGLLATVTWPAGTMLVQIAPNNLANIWPLSCERTVSQPNIDLQWGIGNMLIARGSRFFIKFSSVPLEGQTDNAYNLSTVTVALAATRLRTRGAAQ